VVGVDVPDEGKRVHHGLFHTFPLCFKLEAVIICMVAKGDVAFPCRRVANLLICKVVFLAEGHSGAVYNASGNCLGVSIQSSVLNAYLGLVMSMPLGWLPRGGGGPVPMDMVVCDNFLQSLRENG
jgi:hypothetical protein